MIARRDDKPERDDEVGPSTAAIGDAGELIPLTPDKVEHSLPAMQYQGTFGRALLL